MKGKKYLKDLSREELKKVYSFNSRLVEMVEECYVEDENMYIQDVIEALGPGVAYYDYSFFSLYYSKVQPGDDILSFLDGVIKANRWYGILPEYNYYEPNIEELREKARVLQEEIDYYSDNYDRLETWLLKNIKPIVKDLGAWLDAATEYPAGYLENEYFIDFFVPERLDPSIYILEGGYEAFRDTTESYKSYAY